MRIITLLTDFGKNNPDTAEVKGALMAYSSSEQRQAVTICQDINTGYFLKGAYIAALVGRYYPKGTVHLLMAGLKEATTLLVIEHNEQFFIAPDNGLTSLLGEHGTTVTRRYEQFDAPQPLKIWLPVYLAALQTIYNGGYTRLMEMHPTSLPLGPIARRGEVIKIGTGIGQRMKEAVKSLECGILCVDRFKNIVLHINEEQFYKAKDQYGFQIKVPGISPLGQISQRYSEVRPGQALCRFNSLGYLEISVNARHEEATEAERDDTKMKVLNNLNSDRVVDFETVTINFYEI